MIVIQRGDDTDVWFKKKKVMIKLICFYYENKFFVRDVYRRRFARNDARDNGMKFVLVKGVIPTIFSCSLSDSCSQNS